MTPQETYRRAAELGFDVLFPTAYFLADERPKEIGYACEDLGEEQGGTFLVVDSVDSYDVEELVWGEDADLIDDAYRDAEVYASPVFVPAKGRKCVGGLDTERMVVLFGLNNPYPGKPVVNASVAGATPA